MITIVALVGSSGSGKTHASMYLQEKFCWDAIVSYTTRPMRDGEKNGRDHWFVKKKDKPLKKHMCAYTKFGGYEYWTTWQQFSSLLPMVYVIDEKGILDLVENIKDKPVRLVKVKINRPVRDDIDEERKSRDGERIELPSSFYDFNVNNDTTIDNFHTALNFIANVVNHQHYVSTKK